MQKEKENSRENEWTRISQARRSKAVKRNDLISPKIFFIMRPDEIFFTLMTKLSHFLLSSKWRSEVRYTLIAFRSETSRDDDRRNLVIPKPEK